MREQAAAADEDADEILAEELRHSGGFERLREDLRLRDTLDRLASEVKPIPMEVAQAREAIWTPDKEKPQTETKLWTQARRVDGSPSPVATLIPMVIEQTSRGEALVRHLLAAAQRAHRVPRDSR